MYAPAAHNGRKHTLCDIMYEAIAEYIMEPKVCLSPLWAARAYIIVIIL